MSGVAVIGALLNASAPLLAIVPTARIKAGQLAEGTALPAIAVTVISGADRNVLSPPAVRRVRERVQVTVLATSYREKEAVLKLIRAACADKQGTFGDAANAVVLTDGTGPDFMNDEASIWMRSQDFMVTYNEPV